MTYNFPGPYELRIFYDCAPGAFANVTRVMRFNIDLEGAPTAGTPFGSIDVKRRVGVVVALDTVTNAFVVVLKELLSAADSTIVHAELWKYAVGTFDATYISTYPLAVAGVHASAGAAANVTVFTFRTVEGGILRNYVLEQIITVNTRVPYASLPAVEQDYVDFFTDDSTSYFLGRDTSHPIAFLRANPGTHEHVFKARFRP